MESLIFDIDGTIWDSRALVAEGFNLQLADEGMERYATDAEELKNLFGKTMKEIADRLFPNLPEAQRYPLMERCMDRENRHLEASPCHIGYPGIAKTLEVLSKTYRLFIVSNCQQGYPELVMEKLGIAPFFSGYLCYGDTQAPKGVTMLRLMEKYGISSACYIGDTQGDMEATHYAGLPFVWASYGFGTPTTYEAKISAPADLVSLLKENKL